MSDTKEKRQKKKSNIYLFDTVDYLSSSSFSGFLKRQ